jgi:CRP-like cAMP-binding protein
MLLDGFTDKEKALLHGVGIKRTYHTADAIVGEGDTGNALYLIERGSVEIRKILDGRHYKKIRTLGENDFFGEISFLGIGYSRTAVVIAAEDCHILQIARKKLADFVDEHPAVACKLYQNMAKDLATRMVVNTEQLQEALLWGLEDLT